ncbi:MAG: type I-E CRISPR-associated protein Cas7/Cse4/CasC [Chloroflexi bacterium]|nr:type I-E CRISPR-associated protein Cas7/Cse4/CasC [Chloroflexota bacterium]
MLIEIHAIQNHSPANLNRDDLGAPKTCYFGGVLRSRISSQAIKRSIRTSSEFQTLLGGVRTRRLAQLVAAQVKDSPVKARAEKVLALCGFEVKETTKKSSGADEDGASGGNTSKALVYTTHEAIREMASLLQDGAGKSDQQLAREFAELIAKRTAVPDMALSGRMLEPDKSARDPWRSLETTVEAALQVAHAISTHEARPEVDYYVAKDDVPGEDAGAGFVDEAMFASACFYKYFSINWETLLGNLSGYGEQHKELAAHTVGAFLRGMAMVNPSGMQNRFAAHNRPDGILVEIRDTPINYMNAFANPVTKDDQDVISQSIAQLGQYVHDLDTGYGRPQMRFWFSPNGRYPLTVQEGKADTAVAEHNLASLEDLVRAVITGIGYDWDAVQRVVLNGKPAL